MDTVLEMRVVWLPGTWPEANKEPTMTERVEEIRRAFRLGIYAADLAAEVAINDLLTALAQAERERDECERLKNDAILRFDELDRQSEEWVQERDAARAEVERLKGRLTRTQEWLERFQGAASTETLAKVQAEAALARVQAALEWLWWTACHVEVEPVDAKLGTDVRPRTLSEVMTETERAEIRAALEGRGEGGPYMCSARRGGTDAGDPCMKIDGHDGAHQFVKIRPLGGES